MHWIIQDNLINPATRAQLGTLLESRGVAYTGVRLIPIFDLLDHDAPAVSGPSFVYGSTGLGNVTKAQGWAPGYYDENLDYELALKQYGTLALNSGAVCSSLLEMPRHFDTFFVRPVLDNKSFAGTVMTWAEFEVFRENIAKITDDQDATLRLTDRIVVAPLTVIAAEYRFFVIAGQVVTGSLYKAGDVVRSSAHVPPEVWAFAQHCADTWRPNDAFTLDVALTAQGPKVIELNSANSAGFYACDVGAIIDAVNANLS